MWGQHQFKVTSVSVNQHKPTAKYLGGHDVEEVAKSKQTGPRSTQATPKSNTRPNQTFPKSSQLTSLPTFSKNSSTQNIQTSGVPTSPNFNITSRSDQTSPITTRSDRAMSTINEVSDSSLKPTKQRTGLATSSVDTTSVNVNKTTLSDHTAPVGSLNPIYGQIRNETRDSERTDPEDPLDDELWGDEDELCLQNEVVVEQKKHLVDIVTSLNNLSIGGEKSSRSPRLDRSPWGTFSSNSSNVQSVNSSPSLGSSMGPLHSTRLQVNSPQLSSPRLSPSLATLHSACLHVNSPNKFPSPNVSLSLGTSMGPLHSTRLNTSGDVLSSGTGDTTEDFNKAYLPSLNSSQLKLSSTINLDQSDTTNLGVSLGPLHSTRLSTSVDNFSGDTLNSTVDTTEDFNRAYLPSLNASQLKVKVMDQSESTPNKADLGSLSKADISVVMPLNDSKHFKWTATSKYKLARDTASTNLM